MPDIMLQFVEYLAIALITFLAIRLYDHLSKLLPARSRDVASQTQTTYTEVTGAARPRFRVLSEHSHG
jgi:hypothetical protein